MKFTILFSLSAIGMTTSAFAESFTIPKDLADGAYIISMDADGTQITTDLGNITATTSTDSGVDKRAVTWPSGTYLLPGRQLVRAERLLRPCLGPLLGHVQGFGKHQDP